MPRFCLVIYYIRLASLSLVSLSVVDKADFKVNIAIEVLTRNADDFDSISKQIGVLSDSSKMFNSNC